ncbi:hypothetical protein MNBD_ACTINO01-2423, partial [hydrothermal vent metagenome]
ARTCIHPVTVRTETLIDPRRTSLQHHRKIPIRRTQHWTHLNTQHAQNTGIRPCIHRPLINVIEHIDRTDRHTRRTPNTLPRLNNLIHQEIDRPEPTPVQLPTPRIRPLMRIRTTITQRPITLTHPQRPRIGTTRRSVVYSRIQRPEIQNSTFSSSQPTTARVDLCVNLHTTCERSRPITYSAKFDDDVYC